MQCLEGLGILEKVLAVFGGAWHFGEAACSVLDGTCSVLEGRGILEKLLAVFWRALAVFWRDVAFLRTLAVSRRGLTFLEGA